MNLLKKYEKQYMYRICEEQIKNMIVINLICILYGLLSYCFIANNFFDNIESGQAIYREHLYCTGIIFLVLIIGNGAIDRENKKARLIFCNICMLLTTQLFFFWADNYMYYHFIDNDRIDIQIWLMVMCVSVTSFFYSFRDFLILYVGNFLLLLYGIISLHGSSEVKISFINSIVIYVILMMIYIFKHFTELRHFEEQLMYDKIQESKNLMTASMNHELRTPLNSIIGNTQILLSKKTEGEDEKGIIENIFNSAKMMVQLVNDLLDYSKIEAGEFQIVNEEFNLVVLRDNIQSMMKPLAKEKNLSFDMNIEEGTPVMMTADMRRIQQIVINIISNSIKYTKEGSVKCRFLINGDMLKIVTIDTGMGMSKEEQSDLFTPYKRLNEEKTTKIQGTGLGMFVVKQLLDQMNGTIKVESVVEMGTTMAIEIPVKLAANNHKYSKKNDETKNNDSENAPIQYDFTGKTILTVDDTVINNKIVENILESVGAKTYCALDGENCLRFLEKYPVDLLLLDHIMPGMDGIEVLKAIRNSNLDYKDIPIVMLSGNTGEEYQKLYAENGANGWISKPIMVDKLFEIIANLVE